VLSDLYLPVFFNIIGGENQVAINLIVKHVHLKLQEVRDICVIIIIVIICF